MPFYFGTAVLGHEADNHSTQSRDQDDPKAKMRVAGAHRIRSQAMVENQRSKECDKFLQNISYHSRQQTYPCGQK